MKKAFLFSAKNQVTLWGPNGEINDYSAREWSGLVGDYYYGRWNLYFDMIDECLQKGIEIDLTAYHNKSIEFGLYWDHLVYTYVKGIICRMICMIVNLQVIQLMLFINFIRNTSFNQWHKQYPFLLLLY